MKSLFTAHPASVNETYGEHMVVATGFALRLTLGGLACLIHGLLPFLFERTGSSIIAELHQRMVLHRVRHGPESAGAEAPGIATPRHGIGQA